MDFFKTIFLELKNFTVSFAPKLILAILIFFVLWWTASVLSNFTKKCMAKANIDAGITSFLHSVIKATLRIIAVICTVAQLGVNVTSIVAALGAAGVTIGFALKGCLSNLASGALIIINKPFKLGDYLEVNNLEGTVTKIEIMFTTLTTFDNKAVIIPNSKLTEENIINYSAQKTRRLDLKYSISYREDILKVKELLKDIVFKNKKILKKPKAIIAIGEHKESHVEVVVKVWCKLDDYWDIYFDMQENVKLCFDKNNVNIPFNQLDVNIKPNLQSLNQL